MEAPEDHYTTTNDAHSADLERRTREIIKEINTSPPFHPMEYVYKTKTKRQRLPWVYKADYDRLNWKYRIVKRIALFLLIAFAIALKF